MKTVLFTSIGRRIQLLRHFIDSGMRVIGVDMNPGLAPASQIVHRSYRVPEFNNPYYIDCLLTICKKENVDIIVPLYEPELPILTENKLHFSSEGVEVMVSNGEALFTCLDKYKMYQFFVQNNIPSPETFLPEAFDITAQGNWVVKPRRGMASKNVHIVQQGIKAVEIAREVNLPIIQRFVNGVEYTIDAFIDRNGIVRCVVPRERLEVRAGEVSKSITRYQQDIIDESLKVLGLLPFYGPITLQGIMDKEINRFFFTEINPRFGGGVPLSIKAGIPYAKLVAQVQNESILSNQLLPFQNGLIMLRYEEAFFLVEEQL